MHRLTVAAIPRPNGFSPQDVTDFHPGQADWSLDNLPSIIYTLNSPRARNAWKTVTKRPGEKRDQAGHIVYERWPKAGTVVHPLLDFSVLPDRIGTKESWVRAARLFELMTLLTNAVGHGSMATPGSSNRMAGKYFECGC